MANDYAPTPGATIAWSAKRKKRSGNPYIAQLCGYVEDRTQVAARMLHDAAMSATTGWLGVEAHPVKVPKHKPWQGVATEAAVSVWVTRSPWER